MTTDAVIETYGDEISIHTSAREVTDCNKEYCVNLIISIHTSAREVTGFPQSFHGIPKYFNPHFRKGSDVMTWNYDTSVKNFNPHFRKGSDSGSTA